MNIKFQNFLFAATGRTAVSLRTYLVLVFPFGFLFSIEREQQLHPLSTSQAAILALGGELASALYLNIAQYLALGSRKEKIQPLWRCLFVWFSTGLVRGIYTACNANWSFGFDYNFGLRVPVATLYTGFAMALAAFYFGTVERKRIELLALQSLDKFFKQEESELSDLEDRQLQSARSEIDKRFLPQLKLLEAGIKNFIAKSQSSSELQTIDSEIPEILYQQSLRVSQLLEDYESATTHSPRRKKTNSLYRMKFSYWQGLFPKVLSIKITFILLLLGNSISQFSQNGIPGVKVGIIAAILVVSYLLPISQALKRTRIFPPVLYVLGYIGASMLQATFVELQPHFGFILEYPSQPWYSAIKTTIGIYIASVMASLIVLIQSEFAATSAEGRAHRQRVEQLSFQNLERERLIFETQFGTLHGKIAGLTMALHLLASMDSLGKERSLELLAGAKKLLEESLQTLGGFGTNIS